MTWRQNTRHLAAAVVTTLGLFGFSPAAGAADDPVAEAARLMATAAPALSAGRTADAEALYGRAIDLLERAEAFDLELADAYEAMSHLRAQRGVVEDRMAFAIMMGLIRADDPGNRDVAIGESDRLNERAIAHLGAGRLTEAERLTRWSLFMRQRILGKDHPRVGSSLINLGQLYGQTGRYADAEPLLKRALEIHEAAFGPDDSVIVPNALTAFGLLLGMQGRFDEADGLLRRAARNLMSSLGGGPTSPAYALGLSNLATNLLLRGRDAEADSLLQQAAAIYEKRAPDAPELAFVLANLAMSARNQGHLDRAEVMLQRALAASERAQGADNPVIALLLGNLALVQHATGRDAEAERTGRRAVALLEATAGSTAPDLANALVTLAVIEQGLGRQAAALEVIRRATAISAARAGRDDAPAADAAWREQRGLRAQYLAHAVIAASLAEPTSDRRTALIEESFAVAQRATSSAAARALTRASVRAASGPAAGLVRERQDMIENWQAADRALVAQLGRPNAARDAAAITALRTEIARLDATIRTQDERLARTAPALAELNNPAPLTVADARALLGPDEAMLVYLAAEPESFVWALRADRADLVRLPITVSALSDEVMALRRGLDPDFNPTLAPFDAVRAHALYQRVLAPAAPLLGGARHLLVVPDGALESLPLAVLVSQAPAANPETPGDHRAIAWLARDHAVTVLPSVGSLRALRRTSARSPAPAPFVGVGNPVLQGRPGAHRGSKPSALFRGGLADVTAVRQLQPLPETADELRAVARALGADDRDLYLAERASEPQLRKAGLERYRVLSFATHGLMSGDLQGLAEPALVLTPPARATPDNDGLLTASEVAALALNADWVVLSACNTAAADGTPDAGGLSGLAKAFFYAGARSLLVSHWAVPSQATVKLVTGAVETLTAQPTIGRAEALRRAQLAMMDPANPPDFAHPLAWAPFVLAGEGGAGR